MDILMDYTDRPDITLNSRITGDQAHLERVMAARVAYRLPSITQWWNNAPEDKRYVLARYAPEFRHVLAELWLAEPGDR